MRGGWNSAWSRPRSYRHAPHPVHEGRQFRWGYGPNQSLVHEYGRTSLQDPDVYGPGYLWMHKRPMSGGVAPSTTCNRPVLRCYADFSMLADWLAAGMTHYVAITTRFAAGGVIGEMDAVYSSW